MSSATLVNTRLRRAPAPDLDQVSVAACPNGPAAAALLAAGIGATTLGLAIVLVEMSPTIKEFLNLYNPVGPLSGKSTVAVVAYFGSWLGLHMWARGREVHFGRWAGAAFVLLVVGLLLTFPPVFTLFAAGH